jgi:hypothetical protein
METKTNDLIIFEDEDLLGIKDIPCFDFINKNKTYYELENELTEVKNTLLILQKQIESILQRPKQVETIYIYSLNNKMEIINTNCKNIVFNYLSPDPGIIIDIDNVKIKHCHSDYNNLNKFLQTFRNINEININISFPVKAEKTNHFMPYLNIIKNIVKLNNEIKIIINISTISFEFNWLEYIFEDIIIENIKTINISYQSREDLPNTRIVKEVMKKLDKNITDKIILNVIELKLHHNIRGL